MTLCLFVLGLAFSVPNLGPSMGWIAPVSLMAYVGFYAVGLGPVFWLVLSKIYPLRMRGRAISVGTIATWGANLIVALTFLTLTEVLGKSATFWLYGAISIGTWFFAFFMVPETKGKTQRPRSPSPTIIARLPGVRCQPGRDEPTGFLHAKPSQIQPSSGPKFA